MMKVKRIAILNWIWVQKCLLAQKLDINQDTKLEERLLKIMMMKILLKIEFLLIEKVIRQGEEIKFTNKDVRRENSILKQLSPFLEIR